MQDRGVVVTVLTLLGAVALSCIVVLAILLLHDKSVDAPVLLLFSNLATGALGGITGLLANTHTSPPNPPEAVVPVQPAAAGAPAAPVVLRPSQPANQPKGA